MEDISPTLREELERLADEALSEEARAALKQAARIVKQVDDNKATPIEFDRVGSSLIDPPQDEPKPSG